MEVQKKIIPKIHLRNRIHNKDEARNGAHNDSADNPNSKLLQSLADPLPSYLQMCQSSIPGAGWGIFTNVFLPKGYDLGIYRGKWVSTEEFIGLPETSLYLWEVKDFRGNKNRPHGVRLSDDTVIGYIDAGNPEDASYHRFINHPRTIQEENVEACQSEGNIIYLAKRDIKPGEELLVYYGPDYSEYLIGKKELE